MTHRGFLRLAFLLALAPSQFASAADSLFQQVTIYRDNYGVPHIVGVTEEATFFGYGYAQAEDHLEQMMLEYRDAQGRRAEVLGAGAIGFPELRFFRKDYRWGGDYLQRLLRTKRCVTENKYKIDPHVYTLLAAFARGVNAYITEHRANIPDWIESITAEDIEALERSYYMRFYSINDALQKLEPNAYKFPSFGSNQWAISPDKSQNGRVLHVEETHMPWSNRFQNYEAHLITPGQLNAAGISWFGSPFFLDGFNEHITWSATWNQPNIADLYEERLNPENPKQYFYDGHWREMRVEDETIRFRGKNKMEAVTLPAYYTHHGPVVKFERSKNRAYAVRVPNFEGVNYSTGMYALMKVRNLVEFKATLSRQLIPRWNLLYSDAKNIFWVSNGNVAYRADGFDWSKPVPGWTRRTEWGSYLPFRLYPQLENPASGFLQNCNNPPWAVTKDSGIQPLEPVAYYLRERPQANPTEMLNTRGERLLEVLSEEGKFTLGDMQRLAFDTYVTPADVIVPLLQNAYADQQASEGQNSDPRIVRALDLIKAWNRRSSANSAAYTYIYFWGKAYEELSSSDLFSRFLGYSRRKIAIHSREEQALARRALEMAIDHIQKDFGRSEVPWGEVNVSLRGRPFPMDGTGLYDVLHPDDGPMELDGRIHSNDGWGHMMIVMEGAPKRIWTLLPYGESEHRSSPHFNDQANLHSQQQLKVFWFLAADIQAHLESVRGRRNRIVALIRQQESSGVAQR